MISFRMPPDLGSLLDRVCEDLGRSRAAVTYDAIRYVTSDPNPALQRRLAALRETSQRYRLSLSPEPEPSPPAQSPPAAQPPAAPRPWLPKQRPTAAQQPAAEPNPAPGQSLLERVRQTAREAKTQQGPGTAPVQFFKPDTHSNSGGEIGTKYGTDAE
jgi:hypothetical protein